MIRYIRVCDVYSVEIMGEIGMSILSKGDIEASRGLGKGWKMNWLCVKIRNTRSSYH